MEFPLTEDIISQILYAMEDQQRSFAIDRESGRLVRADGEEGRGKREGLLPLPTWQPIDGFQLMERFVSGLRNPLFRERLREALASGKGVFRKFKDILKEEPEVERLWFGFKDRELRRVVWNWYNEQRELAGLERLEEEPLEEEHEELLETDFGIGPAAGDHLEELWRLDWRCFQEGFPGADARRLHRLYQRRRRRLAGPLDDGSLVRVASTPDGRFAGFFWAVERKDPLTGSLDLHLVQLAVRHRFRGLGLGSLLLKSLAAEARDRGYGRVTARLEGAAVGFRDHFTRLGFATTAERLALDPAAFEG